MPKQCPVFPTNPRDIPRFVGTYMYDSVNRIPCMETISVSPFRDSLHADFLRAGNPCTKMGFLKVEKINIRINVRRAQKISKFLRWDSLCGDYLCAGIPCT